MFHQRMHELGSRLPERSKARFTQPCAKKYAILSTVSIWMGNWRNSLHQWWTGERRNSFTGVSMVIHWFFFTNFVSKFEQEFHWWNGEKFLPVFHQFTGDEFPTLEPSMHRANVTTKTILLDLHVHCQNGCGRWASAATGNHCKFLELAFLPHPVHCDDLTILPAEKQWHKSPTRKDIYMNVQEKLSKVSSELG